MKCRRIKEEYSDVNRRRTVVWFGSYGRNDDGTAKFFNRNDKHDNFSDKAEAVVDSLMQRLSVIQKELWYNVSYGLPLVAHNRSKLMFDSSTASIILSHPDVESILQFQSKIEKTSYSCNFSVKTKYGVVDVTI